MFIVKTDITWKSHFCIIRSRWSSIQNCLHSMLSHPKSVLGNCRHIVNICWMNDHHWYESTVQRKGSIPKVNSVSFIWVGLRVNLEGFLGGSVVKKKKIWLQCRRHRSRQEFDPWVRKIPLRRAWQPTPVFLPWRTLWTEEPGRLQSIALHRGGHSWSDEARTHARVVFILSFLLSFLSPCFL